MRPYLLCLSLVVLACDSEPVETTPPVESTAAQELVEPAKAPTSAPEEPTVEPQKSEEFVVSRTDVLNALEAHQVQAMGQAFVHSGSDGAPDGYQLRQIEEGSLPAQMGLRDGDIVHQVNGMPLTTPQEVAHAYDRGRLAVSLALQITRAGQPETVNTRIR